MEQFSMGQMTYKEISHFWSRKHGSSYQYSAEHWLCHPQSMFCSSEKLAFIVSRFSCLWEKMLTWACHGDKIGSSGILVFWIKDRVLFMPQVAILQNYMVSFPYQDMIVFGKQGISLQRLNSRQHREYQDQQKCFHIISYQKHRLEWLSIVCVRQVRRTADEVRFVLWQIIQNLIRQIQSVLYNLLRCQPEPLRHGNVCELRRLENLQQHDIVAAGILNVMAESHWDVSHVTGPVIESLRTRGSLVDCDACGSC